MTARARRRHAIAAAALLSGALACGEDPATQPPATATARDQSEVVLTVQTVVRARNPIGPILANGENLGPMVRWILDKSVTAPSAHVARGALPHIMFESETIGDTLAVRVAAPLPSGGVSYASLLTLGIPARTACVLDPVAGEARVSYLLADLTIAGAGPVTVSEHVGSCRVESPGGDVSVHMLLPHDSDCIVFTESGRITVRVQRLSSAQVSLRTASGAIAVTNLTLTNVVETPGSLTGVLGLGAGAIRLTTGAGDIELNGY
jgi:hypothetical protein